MHKGKSTSQSINKIVRCIDAIDEEQRHVREKFKHNANLVGIKARENIKELVKTALALKCYYRINHYRERDRTINRGEILVEYLRCSRVESWEHIV